MAARSSAGHQEDDLFLIVHVPKTGGQTLRRHLEKVLVPHESFVHLGPDGYVAARQAGLPSFEARAIEWRQRVRVIAGHDVHDQQHLLVPGRRPRYLTFLRDPSERMVSHYNFDAERFSVSELGPFDAWAGQRRDFTVRWLWRSFLRQPARPRANVEMFEAVQAALATFWFVGCTELMDRDVAALLASMGVAGLPSRANVTGRDHPRVLDLDEATRQRLYQANPFDWELYQYWRARRDLRLGSID